MWSGQSKDEFSVPTGCPLAGLLSGVALHSEYQKSLLDCNSLTENEQNNENKILITLVLVLLFHENSWTNYMRCDDVEMRLLYEDALL